MYKWVAEAAVTVSTVCISCTPALLSQYMPCICGACLNVTRAGAQCSTCTVVAQFGSRCGVL